MMGMAKEEAKKMEEEEKGIYSGVCRKVKGEFYGRQLSTAGDSGMSLEPIRSVGFAVRDFRLMRGLLLGVSGDGQMSKTNRYRDPSGFRSGQNLSIHVA